MIARALPPISLSSHAGRMASDFAALVGVPDARAAVVLWRRDRSEVVFARDMSAGVLSAFEAVGAGCLDGLTRRAVQPVRMPVTLLPDDCRALRDALRREGLNELAVLPLEGETGQTGAIVVPLDDAEVARVTVSDANWRLLARGLDRLRMFTKLGALRAVAETERREKIELPEAVVAIDAEGRVLLTAGFMASQPGWEDPFGLQMDRLPDARTLLSLPSDDGAAPEWHARTLSGARGQARNVRIARVTVTPDARAGWGDARVFLLRDVESAEDSRSAGRERLLQLVMQATLAADRLSHAARMTEGRSRRSARTSTAATVRAEVDQVLAALEEILARGTDRDDRAFVDVNATVDAVVEASSEDLKADGVRVFRFPAAELPDVPADPTLVHRALTVLVDAARDSLRPGGGTLTVRTRAEDGWVLAVVSDDGRGHGDRAPRLGTPLFEDAQDKLPAALATVEELVSRLGGKLESESRPGLWTRVTLYFRLGRARDATHRPAPLAERSLSVLVVDDNAALRSVLRRCLETRGHSVIEATDGAHGLEMASAGEFDRVLVDVQMPVKSGVELYIGLDQVAPGLKDRVIFVTGGFTEAETQEFVEGAGRPVLQKPFDLRCMVEAIESTG